MEGLEITAQYFSGCNTVISCLGAKSTKEVGSIYLNTMEVAVKAMRENNINRIVTMTSWGTYSKRILFNITCPGKVLLKIWQKFTPRGYF